MSPTFRICCRAAGADGVWWPAEWPQLSSLSSLGKLRHRTAGGHCGSRAWWWGCRIRSPALHGEGGRWPNPPKAAGVSEGQRQGSGKVRECPASRRGISTALPVSRGPDPIPCLIPSFWAAGQHRTGALDLSGLAWAVRDRAAPLAPPCLLGGLSPSARHPAGLSTVLKWGPGSLNHYSRTGSQQGN